MCDDLALTRGYRPLDQLIRLTILSDMKTITAREFFRQGAHKKHLAQGEPVLVTTDGQPDFYVIKAGPSKVKTIEEIKAENARVFGKKPKTRFDSRKVLRELRG
jgi:hypothetical protein